jgi:hypothetical protein
MKTKKVKNKTDIECGHMDTDNNNSVYMFHNIKNNIHLFINAYDLKTQWFSLIYVTSHLEMSGKYF